MHHQTGGLDQHDQIVILIFYLERDILTLGFGIFRLRHGDLDPVAAADLLLRLGDGGTVDENGSLLNQRLETAAGKIAPTSAASQESSRPSASSQQSGLSLRLRLV